jgi:hypothetical protein
LNIPLDRDSTSKHRLVLHLINPTLAQEHPSTLGKINTFVNQFIHNHFAPFSSRTLFGEMGHKYFTMVPVAGGSPIEGTAFKINKRTPGALATSLMPEVGAQQLWHNGTIRSGKGNVVRMHPKALHTIFFPPSEQTATLMLVSDIGKQQGDIIIDPSLVKQTKEAILADKRVPLSVLCSEVIAFISKMGEEHPTLKSLLTCELPLNK